MTNNNIIINESNIIKVQDGHYYFKTFELTSKKIEAQIANIQYKGMRRIKDEQVEKAHIPYGVVAFYELLYTLERVPTQEELIEYYLFQDGFTQIDKDTYKVDFDGYSAILKKEGLVARLLRGYPSYIRDLHFMLVCKENKKFDSVSYSLIDDLDGADIKVMYKGKPYNFALYVDTNNSRSYAERKHTTRHSNLKLIDLPMNFNECNTVGDFKLYGIKHMISLINNIK